MASFRTFCPTCDLVQVPPSSIVIQPGGHHDVVDMTFVCPSCDDVVHQPLNWWAVPVMEEAGCTVVDDRVARQLHPSNLDPLTEAEIIGFRAALDEPDWDELLQP